MANNFVLFLIYFLICIATANTCNILFNPVLAEPKAPLWISYTANKIQIQAENISGAIYSIQYIDKVIKF
jgi:hypothetical protein